MLITSLQGQTETMNPWARIQKKPAMLNGINNKNNKNSQRIKHLF